MKTFSFKCATCEEVHSGIPSLGSHAPIYYFSVPEAERAERIFLTEDTCVLDGSHFFVRGCLDFAVIGYEETFSFGAWMSLSEANFERFEALFHIDDRAENKPMGGWLSSRLYPFEGTEKLVARIHFRNHGIRPLIVLEPSSHPLAKCQREGMPVGLLGEILTYYLH